jgi:hypothetical protein
MEDDDLISTRRSISYWIREDSADSRLKNVPDYYSLSDTHMLIQDVSVSVLPVPGYGKRKYEVVVEPMNLDTQRQISQALKDDRHGRGLTNAAYDFFQRCSSTLIAYGECYYEVVYLQDSLRRPVKFLLLPIHPLTIIRRGKRILQYIPKQIANERGLANQKVELSAEDVLRFALPTYVMRKHRFMMESLAFSSVNFSPDFVMSNLKGETNVPFDLEVFSRARKIALARATREIGWSGRQLLRNEMLEYYMFHRHLVFEKFKCELRNQIIDVLNSGIARAGKLIGFDGHLVIQGLPTIPEIDQALERLQAGHNSFDEVMKPFI